MTGNRCNYYSFGVLLMAVEKERGGAHYEGSENEGGSNFLTDVPDRCAEYLSYADAALVIF